MSNSTPVAARFGSGQAVKRVEDASLLIGKGQFADNVPVAGASHIAFLRSPYAHAKIASIDTAAAAAMPGVIAVYTGAQLVAAGVKPMPKLAGFPRANGQPPATALRYALALDTVRFVGEAVAAVVAESREAAKDAAEAVMVDYEELPAVVDPVRATAPGAPVLCPEAPDNIAAELRHGSIPATEAAFAAAAHSVSLDLVNQRLAPSPMEPRSIVATFDAAANHLTVREMAEELGEGITCGPLLYVVENFFEYAGKAQHEIGLYYRAQLPPGSRLLRTDTEHAGVEGDKALVFAWFPRAMLDAVALHPLFLKAALRDEPVAFRHVVQRD